MDKRNGPPSAHDVARIAGVSQAAVSRAFTPGASISDTTREKVFVAAKELGYRPNLLARSLIKGHSGIIGVVVGNARNPFFTVALDVISSRLRRAGRHLLVFTGESNATADVPVEDLLKYRVDGLVLMWTTMSPALAEQCRNEGIPVVFFNRRAGTTAGFATVSGANAVGTRKIASHLLEQGYRRFAFMAGLEDSSTNREREEGFTAELAAHGFPPPARAVGHFRRNEGMEAARHLLSLDPRPDAIFCASDIMALGAIEVARYEFGLEVGREVGIVGFDDIEQSAWPSFELTSYSQPVDTMMEKVIDLLLDSSQYEQLPHIIVEGELKMRASTRRGQETE
jgi:DNA-binding LacI/PurR family transcriptional regulator